MKNLIIVVILFLAASNLIFSQKKGDTSPMPVGGMEAVAKKVVYPDEIKGKNIKGQVQVMVTVDPAGSILATKIYKALHPSCDSAAVQAVRSVKFKPGEKNGKKVTKKVIIPINF